jgi:hypothetical protein
VPVVSEQKVRTLNVHESWRTEPTSAFSAADVVQVLMKERSATMQSYRQSLGKPSVVDLAPLNRATRAVSYTLDFS